MQAALRSLPACQRSPTVLSTLVQPVGWLQRPRRNIFRRLGCCVAKCSSPWLRRYSSPTVTCHFDGIAPSKTDAKRILEYYIAVELAGGVNEEARRHIRSALDLAVGLQHKRTATFRDAAMCVEATTAVVNIMAIVSGRRDPQ
jgi:hypothetical protein